MTGTPDHDQQVIARVDEAITRLLDRTGLPPHLVDAMRYACLGPGKRVRPLLAWHAAVASGGDGSESLACGVAVELVHAFSLVHDDLPALDNDDLRRGRPTLHRHAGEAMAILAGDAMLTLAFAAVEDAPVSDAGRASLVRELTTATTGMIAGQVYDTLGGMPASLGPDERVVLIHSNKTGALIRAACAMGARSIEPSPPTGTLRAIDAYARAVGLMFQIVDDLLDVTQTTDHAGKRTGKDAAAGKLTYPGVLGVDGSRRRVAELLSSALEVIDPLGPGANGLARFARTLAERTK